jgi:CheY-like chemotaxis protein
MRAIEVARPLIDARHHELSVYTHDGPIIVDGDTTRLAQVIVNLMNNAAKYTPERGRISLTVTRDTQHALIAVGDNGLGLTPALLSRVFDLFAQGERSLARSEGGLGVGLTLARRIVEMHGGTVTASSEGPNRGAEFVVRLPLAAGVSSKQGKRSAASAAAGVCRVLVVDDNDDSAQTMAMMLELGGHSSKIAHDGPAALRMAIEFLPHVILLDIGLPEMDGYEVARRIRDLPELATTMLVAMTG